MHFRYTADFVPLLLGNIFLTLRGHEILIFGGEAYDGRELTFYSAPWWSKFYAGYLNKGDHPATGSEENKEGAVQRNSKGRRTCPWPKMYNH